ncbi:hypothetical protein GCM10009741_55820 [Kribbella lupini]|uniref:Uncharacterized protein n=1 Tax=Kribbella lupini TaxID=291602 RepID=A0ABP4MIJ5_9ACTN
MPSSSVHWLEAATAYRLRAAICPPSSVHELSAGLRYPAAGPVTNRAAVLATWLTTTLNGTRRQQVMLGDPTPRQTS